jgi:hypothetical protein
MFLKASDFIDWLMSTLGLPRRGDAAVIGEWLTKAGYIEQITTKKKDPRFSDSKTSIYSVSPAFQTVLFSNLS